MRWHYNHLPRTKLDFDGPDKLFNIQLFQKFSGDQQDAHVIINISTNALQKDVGLHLSGIDQEGSIFTPHKKKNIASLCLSICSLQLP